MNSWCILFALFSGLFLQPLCSRDFLAGFGNPMYGATPRPTSGAGAVLDLDRMHGYVCIQAGFG
jgi:hypothetical protein